MRRIAFLRQGKKRVIALLTALAMVLGCLSGCSPRREEAGFRVVTSFYPVYIMTLNITEGIEGVSPDSRRGASTTTSCKTGICRIWRLPTPL